MKHIRIAKNRYLLSWWVVGVWSFVVAMSTTSTHAQDQQNDESKASGQELEQITVTGSRIVRDGFESLQPVSVISEESLELRGSLNIADVLNEQAGFGLPGSSSVGTQSADSVGQNFANFLGLGSQRTLTLVNSQRFPSGAAPNGAGGLSVDLNAIPSALVERVETIAIGGAPAYGADAIAGTVNLILKDDFEGLETTLSGGTSPGNSDAERYKAGVTWGSNFNSDRSNIVIAGAYTSSSGLLETERDQTRDGLGFFGPSDPNSPFDRILIFDPTVAVDNRTGGPLFSGNQFAFNIFGNGIPLDPRNPNSALSAFDENGDLVPFIPGGGTSSPIFQQGGDGLDLNELSALYTDTERYNANLFFNHQISENLRFKGELWYAKTEATELVNQPDYNSPAFGGLPVNSYGDFGEGPVAVLLNNPFLTDNTRQIIGLATDFNGDGVPDNNVDTNNDGIADAPGFYRFGGLSGLVGSNANSSERTTNRIVLGLEGDASILERDIAWSLTYSHGTTESKDIGTEILQNNFNQALLVTSDANGNPVCVDPSNGCQPLNIVGQATEAARDYVTTRTVDRVDVGQEYLQGNLSTELFSLPAGSIGFASGFSYRKEDARFTPNEFATSGQLRTPLVPIQGDFTSKEVYAETVIPLLGGDLDTPFVDLLEIEGAIRYVDNSRNGSDITWTAGGRYRPVPSFELRGNYTKSIRNPSITELFTPTSRIDTFADDPCDARFINAGNFSDRRRENCLADGIPVGFQSFIVNAAQPGTLSGNSNLGNEISDSWTAGIIVRSPSIGLTASFDWMEIEISEAIETLNATDILNACYDSSNPSGEAACDLFSRTADGQVTGISTGFVNVGLLEFSGLISSLSFSHGLGKYGEIDYTLNHIFTDDLVETVGAGNPNRNDGEIGNSKHRVNLSTVWRNGPWRIFSQIRWIDSAVFDASDTPTSRDVLGVDSWVNVDLGVSYQFNENINILLNVDNLFDNEAPFAAAASDDAIQAYFPGILERYVTLGINGSF